MSIFEYIILFGSVLLGGAAAMYVQRNSPKFLQLLLSFSGAYILGITCVHLLPEVYGGADANIGLWILVGFFVQLFLEQLSKGIEHGHIHVHEDEDGHQHTHSSTAVTIMVGLCLHAFIEGLPLAGYAHLHEGHDHGNHLLYGIIIHKIPAAFALVLLLLLSNFKKWQVILCLVIFASMSPLAAAIMQLGNVFEDPKILKIVMGIVVGTFLHIATTILFESDTEHHHRIPLKKFLVILVGVGLAVLTMHSHAH